MSLLDRMCGNRKSYYSLEWICNLFLRRRERAPNVCSHQTTTSQTLRGQAKTGMQPILPVVVPVTKIKGTTHHYADGNGVVWCKQTFTIHISVPETTIFRFSAWEQKYYNTIRVTIQTNVLRVYLYTYCE